MNRKKILVVDRDEDLCRSIGEYLKEEYEVFCIHDGKEVLTRLNKEHFDLLLTDIDIPNVYIYNLLNQIKDHFSYLPVILMYVYCDYTQVMEETIRKVADAILSKPFDIEELKKRIDYLIRSFASTRLKSS